MLECSSQSIDDPLLTAIVAQTVTAGKILKMIEEKAGSHPLLVACIEQVVTAVNVLKLVEKEKVQDSLLRKCVGQIVNAGKILKFLEEQKVPESCDPLFSACVEQIINTGKMLKFLEEQKLKNDAAVSKIAELENQLEAAENSLKVYKNDPPNEEKIKELKENLEKRVGEVKDLEFLVEHLMIKERMCNDELVDARKVLIKHLQDKSCDNNDIGIRRMGELDLTLFQNACKRKFPSSVAMSKAALLTSWWEAKLEDRLWLPFKMITAGGKIIEKIIDVKDSALQDLRSEWGDGVYDSITAALEERSRYNQSRRTVTSELWNFKKGRKATLKEVICHMEELRHKKKAPDLPKLAEKEKKEDADKVAEIGKLHKSTKMNGEVLKRLADEARLAQQTVVELKELLEKKKEEIKDLQALWIQHAVKEQELKSELTEVREKLIVGLADVLDENSSIQLKKMGEIDQIAFERACKGIFGSDFATTKAAELRSFWQEKVECQLWHPFKLIISGGEDVREILDVEDKTLQELRSQWGKEIYELVTTALKERKDCDPSSRTMELWNCICKRKATLMEAFHFMLGRMEKGNGKRKASNLEDPARKACKLAKASQWGKKNSLWQFNGAKY